MADRGVRAALRLVALGVALAVAIVAPGALAPRPLATDPSAAPGFSVALSATPSFGTAPLEVLFDASVSSGSPTFYNWSFGDGATLNGTEAAFADPSHVYASAGTFTASVNVTETSGVAPASIVVHVVAAPLAITISARPGSGTAPLTVTFRANVTGGTGTYLTVNWSFGDGQVGSGPVVQYTYPRSGDFYVTVRVEDSGRSTASAATWENLTAATDAPAVALTTIEVWAAVGFAAGVGAVLLAFVARARWGRGGSTLEHGLEPVPPAAPAAPSVPSTPAGLRDPVAPSPPVVDGAPPALRLSQRIVVHLAGQGTLGPHEVAPFGLTQGGMAAALGVRQNGLTNVLRRLVAAGVVEEDLRHVRGQARRLKVYRLTPRGVLLARELRHRPPPGPSDNAQPPVD